MSFPPGWGNQSWGGYGWGGPTTTGLQLVSALAIAENVVQLQFNLSVYFSGLGDVPDGSNASLYTVAPVAGTVGYDGAPARTVRAVMAALALPGKTLPAGSLEGTCVDVTFDRPMTPYPSQYTIVATGLYSADLSQALDPAANSEQFYGVFKGLVPASVELPTPTRDFANPQSLSAALDPLPVPLNPNVLGVFSIDDSGDYAFDSGMTAFKKRIYRRLITNPGAFLHLGAGYGVGVPSYGKQLARAATVQALAGKAEDQIGQEPETNAVKVLVAIEPNAPGLVRFNIYVRTRGGQSAKYTAPFRSG